MLLVSALWRPSVCSFPLHLCMALWGVAYVPTWTCTWLGQRPFSPVHFPSQPWALILCLQEGLMRQRTGKKLLCPFSGEAWNANPDWCAVSWVGWLPSPSMVLPPQRSAPRTPSDCLWFSSLMCCPPTPQGHLPCTASLSACCALHVLFHLPGRPPPPPPRKFLLTSFSGRLFQLRQAMWGCVFLVPWVTLGTIGDFWGPSSCHLPMSSWKAGILVCVALRC